MTDTIYQIVIVLIVTIIEMVGFWLFFGRTLVTRDEVSDMIQTESPYVADKKFILEAISDKNDVLKDLSRTLNELKVEIAQLRAERGYISANKKE